MTNHRILSSSRKIQTRCRCTVPEVPCVLMRLSASAFFPSNARQGAPCTFGSDKGQPRNEYQKLLAREQSLGPRFRRCKSEWHPKKMKKGIEKVKVSVKDLPRAVLIWTTLWYSECLLQFLWILSALSYHRKKIHCDCAKIGPKIRRYPEFSCDTQNQPQNSPNKRFIDDDM